MNRPVKAILLEAASRYNQNKQDGHYHWWEKSASEGENSFKIKQTQNKNKANKTKRLVDPLLDRGLALLEVLLRFCLATNVLEIICKDKPSSVYNSGTQLVWNPKYLWKYDPGATLW